MSVRGANKGKGTKWIRFRIVCVGTTLAFCFGLILCRAVQLQVLSGSELCDKAEKQVKQALQTSPRRGAIYDRNHKELAVSSKVSSICAYPKGISSPRQTASALARSLNLKQGPIFEKLSSGKSFVWIKRHANPKEASAVKALNLTGVDFVEESRRFYPMKTLAAQVVGFCGTDGRGLEGIEYYYNPVLNGRQSKWTVFKDALGRSFKSEADSQGRKDGHDLLLTIDTNIQYVAEKALAESVEKFEAKSGIAVVMVPGTGAILAMAHVPQFNPNSFGQYKRWFWRNRAITDCFEPGSTFKIFLAASALESGLCTPDSEFYCEEGRYEVGNNVVHDVHAYGPLSLRDILKYSSNIGAAKIGEKIGSAYFYRKLEGFGFGAKTGIDCPGESPGVVQPLEGLSDMDALATCFGQGLSASALQLTAAVSAVANDGILMKPYLVQGVMDRQGYLVERFTPKKGRRVISSKVARCVTRMLERVVAKGGTGVNAAVRGYRVAGKTGTAQKVDPKEMGYARGKYIAAFAGFVPARDPKITILVVVDEPKKQHYGGVVAAPVFRRIAQESLQHLKIPPELVIPNEAVGSIRASREGSPMG
ncbi:MAG: penicillin-binding protein 2 [Deltaproteobacteria bacterium]|jgi:cell division protein FtsI (penicillin-binding protein 3)